MEVSTEVAQEKPVAEAMTDAEREHRASCEWRVDWDQFKGTRPMVPEAFSHQRAKGLCVECFFLVSPEKPTHAYDCSERFDQLMKERGYDAQLKPTPTPPVGAESEM